MAKKSCVKDRCRVGLVGVCLVFLPIIVHAQARQIQWWHAMGGVLGERVGDIAKGFNDTQQQCEVVPTYKGNYT